jgi:hypothetical protein
VWGTGGGGRQAAAGNFDAIGQRGGEEGGEGRRDGESRLCFRRCSGSNDGAIATAAAAAYKSANLTKERRVCARGQAGLRQRTVEEGSNDFRKRLQLLLLLLLHQQPTAHSHCAARVAHRHTGQLHDCLLQQLPALQHAAHVVFVAGGE